MLADTTTPVSIYLRLRDVYPNSILLESSDYHSRENSMSFVCADPVAGIILKGSRLETYFPDGAVEITESKNLIEEIADFKDKFSETELPEIKFISSGLFGYFTWNAVQHFEDIKFTSETPDAEEGDFKDYLNPESLTVLPNVYIEPALADADLESRYQFIRKGYFCLDRDSTADKLVFNRTVTLKDTFKKPN